MTAGASCIKSGSWLTAAFLFASAFLLTPTTQAQDTKRPAPQVTGPTVAGVVKTPNGANASGATVFLRHSPRGTVLLPTHPERTTTDAQGRFRFDEVAAGPYRVWAETDDFTSLERKLGGRSVRVEESASGQDAEITLKLHPGCGYDVTVVAADSGEVIDGARISFGWTDIVREYKTEGDGIARIRNLGLDDWYFVVGADGYATEFKKTSKQELGSILPLRFTLAPGGKITGTLRDEAGNPLADATVSVAPGDVSMSPGYGKMQTDAQGSFSFEGLPIGRPLRLLGRIDGYDYGQKQLTVATRSSPTRADLVCKKQPYGGDVIIEVVAANGSPIAGATLINRGNSSSMKRTATTDSQGRARLSDLYSGYAGCSVTVKAEHFIPQRLPVDPGTIEHPARLKFQLQVGRTLQGTVVKPDGTPAPNLRVYYNGGERMNDLGGRVDTDDQGRFEIKGLPDQTTLTVYAPREFAPIRGLVVPEDAKDFRVVMSAAGLIRVRATDAVTGKPVKEFNVRLGFSEIRKPDDPRAGGISSAMINPGVNIQGTKKEFRLDGQLVGAPYKVIVSAAGYEPKTLARVEAQPADSAQLMDVALERIRLENYQTVAGRLLDADDKPIVGAQVRLLLGSEEPHRIDPFTMKRRQDGWRFYHWDLLRHDNMENRSKCVQLLRTASDDQGRFKFEGVKRDPPWMELFYFRENLMSQRYSNLRSREPTELSQLTLKAERPATLRVAVDFSKYPSAHSVSLQPENYIQGPNALKMAFGHASEEIPVDAKEIVFNHLPSGVYVVGLSERPVSLGNGGYRVKGITGQTVTVAEGEELDVRF